MELVIGGLLNKQIADALGVSEIMAKTHKRNVMEKMHARSLPDVCCGLQGLGLIQPARYQVREHLESGALVAVLQQFEPVPMPVSLLYPQNRTPTAKLRLFAEWVAEIFRQHPDFTLQK
jgi:DNA-binding transcriptional LysR family regulator